MAADPAQPDLSVGVAFPPQPSALRLLRSRGPARGIVALLGPAFVAAVAYIDPGNFATNFSAGAVSGYGLAWARTQRRYWRQFCSVSGSMPPRR